MIPKTPGAFSAMGLLCTNVVHDFIRSDLRPYEHVPLTAINDAFRALESKALDVITSEGFSLDKATFIRETDMRYSGQGHELRVPVSSGKANLLIDEEEKQFIRMRFDSLHEKLRGHKAEEEPVELVSYRVRVLVDVPRYDPSSHPSGPSSSNEALKGKRKIYLDGQVGEISVYDRNQLGSSGTNSGPCSR